MNMLRDLLYRLQDSGWLEALPPALRQPPGLWVLLVLLAVALLIVFAFIVRLTGRLLFGRALEDGTRAEGEMRRGLKRDIAEMKRQGNHLGLGELYEDLGRFKKALAAYKKGGHDEARAALLAKLGKRREARKAARDAGAWRLYAEICQEDGDLGEAAVAFERDGAAYLAARCYEASSRRLDAARCYIAAGMEAQAVEQLTGALDLDNDSDNDSDDDSGDDSGDGTGSEGEAGPEIAELLESALRASIAATGARGLSLELAGVVRRTVQLHLAHGEPRRAFELAVTAEQYQLAVPVARDYLEPDAAAAEVCEKAGAPLVAAEIWRRLGDRQKAALLIAEHHRDHGDAAESARRFEEAEAWSDAADQWAAAGESARAAELFRRGGDLQSAAQIYAQTGDTARSQQILSQAHALSVEGRFESDATAPFINPSAGHSTAFVSQPGFAETKIDIKTESQDDQGRKTQPAADSKARYQLVEELGRGGMGIVYRAEDRMLQREVAYKILPEEVLSDDITPESLLAEARAAARLSHPNIVQIYDAGRRGEGFFIVMELVRGKTLEKMLEERRLTIRGAVQIGRQILAALAHAHERRLVHRDLKPSNLIWGEDNRLKLSDFGLARAFEASVGNVRTQPAGTPSYMSPEQIRGEALSPQTDLYAFGCVMWEMLTRQPVFGTGATSFHHHLTSPPSDPRTRREDIPPPLAELILQCLAKDPKERPPSADSIAKRLAAMV